MASTYVDSCEYTEEAVRTIDRGWSSRLGVGQSAKQILNVNITTLWNISKAWDLDWSSDHLEDLSVDGRIRLNLIFKEGDGEAWTRLSWLRTGTGGGRCRYGTAHSGCVNSGFLGGVTENLALAGMLRSVDRYFVTDVSGQPIGSHRQGLSRQILTFGFHKIRGISWLAEGLLAS
jgi:hypothetical protein